MLNVWSFFFGLMSLTKLVACICRIKTCRFRYEPRRLRELIRTLMGIVEGHCTRNDVSEVIVLARGGVVQVEVLQMAIVDKLV